MEKTFDWNRLEKRWPGREQQTPNRLQLNAFVEPSMWLA